MLGRRLSGRKPGALRCCGLTAHACITRPEHSISSRRHKPRARPGTTMRPAIPQTIRDAFPKSRIKNLIRLNRARVIPYSVNSFSVRTNNRTYTAKSSSSADTHPTRGGRNRCRSGGEAPCRRHRLRSTPLSLAGRISPGSKSIRTCQRVVAPPYCECTSDGHPESAGQRRLLFGRMLRF